MFQFALDFLNNDRNDQRIKDYDIAKLELGNPYYLTLESNFQFWVDTGGMSS